MKCNLDAMLSATVHPLLNVMLSTPRPLSSFDTMLSTPTQSPHAPTQGRRHEFDDKGGGSMQSKFYLMGPSQTILPPPIFLSTYATGSMHWEVGGGGWLNTVKTLKIEKRLGWGVHEPPQLLWWCRPAPTLSSTLCCPRQPPIHTHPLLNTHPWCMREGNKHGTR